MAMTDCGTPLVPNLGSGPRSFHCVREVGGGEVGAAANAITWTGLDV